MTRGQGTGWFASPNDIFERQDLTSHEKLVALSLCRRLGPDGAAWPSYARIAGDCAISRRSALRAVQGLQDKGVILIKRRLADEGDPTSNLYRLSYEAGGSATVSPPSDTVAPGVVTHSHQGGDTVAPEGYSLKETQLKDRQTARVREPGPPPDTDPEPRPSVGPSSEGEAAAASEEQTPTGAGDCESLKDVIALYHRHIGIIGPGVYDEIRAWNADNGMEWAVIGAAVEIAAAADIPRSKRTRYARGILRNLHNDGIFTWEALVEQRKRDGPTDIDAMFSAEELAALERSRPP